MPYILHVDHKVIAASTLAATVSVAVVSSYKWWQLQKTVNARDNVYETARYLNEYLMFHYGQPNAVLKWDFGPKSAVDFPKRCAELCLEYVAEKVSSR
jgi:hypothetical protein